jgi:CheY-like chemotaxis protein
MDVLLLSTDLMLMSIASADKQRDELHVVSNEAMTLKVCGEYNVGLIIVDLRMPGVDVFRLKKHLAELPKAIPVMACAPHVHDALLESATIAGCEEVVTRGQFESRLATTLARLTGN